MKSISTYALIALLAAAPALAGEPGDLVFAERGPWDLGGRSLHWELTQQGPELENFKPLGKGRISLSQIADPSDGQPVLQLAEDTDRIDRKIGPFPISGGDPSLTFFLETVARDMAALTGGSPFYIRNRLKDALFRGGELREEGGLRIATFEPFVQDRNKDRMLGFETLVLSFAIDDPRQPIRRMSARTGPLAGGKPAYVSEMVLE